MIRIFSNTLHMKRGFLFLCCITLVLSCQKKSPVAQGQFMIVHATSDLDPLRFEIDGKSFGSSEVAFPGNTGYQPLPEGKHRLVAFAGGTSQFDLEFITAAEVKQTLFIYGYRANQLVFATVDNLNMTGTGTAGVRFFHLWPFGPEVGIDIINGNTLRPLFVDRPFDFPSAAFANSNFKAVVAGTYTLQVQFGNGIPKYTLDGVQFKEGKHYTVFLRRPLASNAIFELEVIAND